MNICEYMIRPDNTVREAIQAIEKGGKKAVFIVDEDSRLLGLFSDGDMRKYILRNGDLNSKVVEAMNPSPVTFTDKERLTAEMHHNRRVVYPLVDKEGRLVEAVFWNDLEKKVISRSLQDIPLVIMAGGKGQRLKPYTNILPKALVPIGDITITERIINQFTEYNCQRVYLVINHKKNMVKAYFNDLEKPYGIEYAEEMEPLGTGGGIALLREKVQGSFFVSNCDILVDTDLGYLYDYHKKRNNVITIVCAMKNVVMPYGVICLDENERLTGIEEKPTQSFLTNTGLYLLESKVFDYIKEREKIDMTEIIMRMVENGENIGVYPVSEKCWMDMGRIKEMENMVRALEDR